MRARLDAASRLSIALPTIATTIAISVVVATAGLAAPAAAAPRASDRDRCTFTTSTNVPATMRDGTVLRADVYRPRLEGGREAPVLLMRLPYDKTAAQTYVYASPEYYARHCYIVVVQDVRGQYESEGTFYPLRDEARDGYDTIEWAADLPGSNGKVGMYGFSYVGATQWLPAIRRPPHLKAMVPAMTSSDYYEGWTYQDGAFSLAFLESWPLMDIARSAALRLPDGEQIAAGMDQAVSELHTRWYSHLPLDEFPPLHPDDPRIAPYFYDWIRHPTDDAYWKRWSIRRRYDRIEAPALNFDGWYDVFNAGAIENFAGMRDDGGSREARRGQQLVVGPWMHLPWNPQVGELDFGPEARNPIDRLQLRWFDHWLKGIDNGVRNDPPVRVFVMGANEWRSASDWPIPGTRFTDFYLHSDGSANSAAGDGWLSRRRPAQAGEARGDRFTYDPANPVPSVGGHSCCVPDVAPIGPYDQRSVEQRRDVLVYTTPTVKRPVEVTGPITVTLHASSSARDTDFTAKLVDVHPDGRAINLNDGIQRARYRHSTERPKLIEPGRVYRYKINVWPTSNLFKRGHRIRLQISSSNFPMYDRNPNTGAAFGQTATIQKARQTILHDREHPSRLTLPLVEPLGER